MNISKSVFMAAALALLISPAKATLVTSLDITVNGISYTATFHDFTPNLTFNDVWDTNGDGVFGDGINAAFNKTPTFWTDAVGATTARDLLIDGLGLEDWVDVSLFESDSFIFPSQAADPSEVIAYAETGPNPDDDEAAATAISRSLTAVTENLAWVTFEPVSMPVSAPSTLALLLTSLCMGWVVRRRRVLL